MKILITGSDGFIAKNLRTHLETYQDFEVVSFNKDDSLDDLLRLVSQVDFIFHLAGVNRPENEQEFTVGNENLTNHLCEAVKASKKKIPIVFSSSIQADNSSLYGRSKNKAEILLKNLEETYSNPVCICRLPNVFGKWCKPNYNSVVATFSYNLFHDIPINIHQPEHQLNLIYIDDLVKHFIQLITKTTFKQLDTTPSPVYSITVGELAEKLTSYYSSQGNEPIPPVGIGLDRALYATYLSYAKPPNFSYQLEEHRDVRGRFVEVLKTQDSGQFSFFTASPKVTRGGHYHHTKNEKFLVVKGKALFKFQNIITGEFYEQITSDETPEVIITVPGWAHDITNIGDEEMIVMLWANEIFVPQQPDTYTRTINNA